MSNYEKDILRGIMRDLRDGYSFGRDFTSARYPFFDTVLSRSRETGNIVWSHFGRSANRCTLKDLEWILTVIFEMTPSSFLLHYIRNDQSVISY